MSSYNLGFISDKNLFEHVKETVLKYRFNISLAEFNSNLIDPIKLTFDLKVYGQSIEAVLEHEISRQLDKSNTNHIGYFHQNIFKYLGNGWEVPEEGYDVINTTRHIYVEMKNKHNTMNSSSAAKTYAKMQNLILQDRDALCLLVEVIATQSQDIPWVISIDKSQLVNDRIRRVSIDKFYEMVTGDVLAFKKLCVVLPKVIENVVSNIKTAEKSNTIIAELKALDSNLLKSLYLLSFHQYEGFHDFQL
ncbi:Eco47II family restriction endonuclease [Beggiatoa leptomitoformis]|uniref:Eco47II family restriction endonuclease n=1 Tax=Beggiatoa leptomitoformis TaxID=288004 RepID=A0A2N9YD88_9GAMM|nr:Eco47II family restriction endonuclease [Beggiatoa leptomitoformis]ALG69150.1 Eco47II family restriction endonuclease [Beggiatoa leptomitoformis]AUI68430.1 Eco47II family restriction endonuclease [Beggiatoa leptomitoformis]